jgi:hypothetical protein
MGMTGCAWQWIEARDDLAPLATVIQAFPNDCQHTFSGQTPLTGQKRTLRESVG